MNVVRCGIAFLLWLCISAAPAAEMTEFGSKDATEKLTIWGATDLDQLRPTLESFVAANPDISISYRILQSSTLYDEIRAGKSLQPDLAISSAADLQIKLANDGFALEHTVRSDVELPPWASWRNAAFGISAEPAVIVYNTSLRDIGPRLHSRAGLAQAINDNRPELDGRVATYDISQSGLGYLFASQDSLYSSTYTTLMQALGRAHVKLYCCSGDILDAVEDGTALIGYNVLGSYALARKAGGAPIEIVLPEDYTLLLSRVALIPSGAKRPDLGGRFLDFLLSAETRKRLSTLEIYKSDARTTWHPIALNPSLLVFLDPIKRSRFIKAWQMLVRTDFR